MKDYHKSALLETALILLFTVMPSIFIILKMVISSEVIPNGNLYKSGEFYLYSVSLLGSSFLIYNHYKVKKSDLFSLLSILSLILIILFSLGYTVVANTKEPKLNFVKWSSMISIVISTLIFFYSQVINNKKSPDIAEQRRNEQQVIENALN